MESRFEYLNILHTSCCLFVLGIFEIKKNITQTKILFNLVRHTSGYNKPTQHFHFRKVSIIHIFLLGQYTSHFLSKREKN